MSPRRHVSCLGVGLVLVGLAGCAGGPGAGETAVREPAMPTIRPLTVATGAETASRDLVASALNQALSGDRAAALKTLGAINDPADRSAATLEVVTAFAEQNPEAAAALAMEVPDGPVQSKAIDVAARAMVRRDREAAFQWAVGRTEDLPSRLARQAVVEELVAADPRRTIDRIATLLEGSARDDMLVGAAAAWARRDADAAVAWLRSRPDDRLKPKLISGVGFAVAQTRPDRAVSVADMLPEGRDRWLLYSAIAQTWIAVDSKAALAWASAMPAGAGRDAAYSGFETGLGVPILRRVARAPGTRSTMRTRGGVGATALTWPELNSPDFAAWLATQRPGMSHDDAVIEYVRQRGAVQPGTIGQWLTTLPGGATRDRAMEAYLENVLPTAPAEAANLLLSLPRSDRTDEMIDKTAQRWLLTNPDAARAWLDQLNLSPERKEDLLRRSGR